MNSKSETVLIKYPLASLLSAFIIKPLINFIKTYPIIEGEANLCAYVKHQNKSIIEKHAF